MAFKFVAICTLALLHQSIASCIGGPYNAGLGFTGNGFAANGLATNGLATNGLANGLAGNGFGYNGFNCGAGVASSGGGFAVTSSSPIAPTGVSVVSENTYEGNLAVGGSLPLLGTVAVEGNLPTAGAGAVSYGCGDGAIGIGSEAPIATGITTPGAVFPPNSPNSAATNAALSLAPNGLAVNGLAANGLAANGLGYNGLAANGLGYNGLGYNGLGNRFGFAGACA